MGKRVQLRFGHKNITALYDIILKLQENSAQTSFAKITLHSIAYFFTGGKSHVFL
jgi:hypothetical protein